MHPAFASLGFGDDVDDHLALRRPATLAAGPDTTVLPTVGMGTYAAGAAAGAAGMLAVLLVAGVANKETRGTSKDKALATGAVLVGGGALLGALATAIGVSGQRSATVART